MVLGRGHHEESKKVKKNFVGLPGEARIAIKVVGVKIFMVTMFDRRGLPWRPGWNQKFGIILKGFRRAINPTSQKSLYPTPLGTMSPECVQTVEFFQYFSNFF